MAVAAWVSLCGTGSAQYMCGSWDGPSCSLWRNWREQPEYFGGYAEVQMPALSCAGCDGDLVTWLRLSDFSSGYPGLSYVRIGYWVGRASARASYFVQEWPPGGQWRMAFLGPVDQPGTVTRFMIVKDERTIPASFLTFIYTASLSTLWASVSRSAGGAPPMHADWFDFGAELTGTRGISTGTAYARRHIWAVAPLGPEYVFWYWPQTTEGDGAVFDAIPPFSGGWDVSPGSPPPAPEGGVFRIACCTP
jgi:hypothetical protein